MGGTRTFETNRPVDFRPFFSICIPQYNRTEFVIRACQIFASQSFKDFEVCISDDCSNDRKESKLLEYLKHSNLVYTYSRTETNLRYDANLRNAISLSIGRFLLLMGNDDGLSETGTLQLIHDELVRFHPVAVAITNYRELWSGKVFRRMSITGVRGHGPDVATSNFRSYSFLSGIVLEGNGARKSATDAVDGSEMYQMFLGTRLVAAGGRFLAINHVCVDKDLSIPGEIADSYRLKPRLKPCPIVERVLPMGRLLEVIAVALEPYHLGAKLERHIVQVAGQLYRFTYPFWIIEYRRVQSWRYAFGVFIAMRPTRISKGLHLSWLAQFQLWLTYLVVGVIALGVPIRSFDILRPRLYAVAKRFRAS